MPTPYGCTVLKTQPETLELYWSMDLTDLSSGVPLDLSGNGRSGLLGGTADPANGASLIHGGGAEDAMTIAGSGGQCRADSWQSGTYSEFSIALWCRQDTTTVSNEGLFSVGEDAADAGGRIYFQILGGPNPARFRFPNGFIDDPIANWPANTTFFVACTYDGTTGIMYRDGVAVQNGGGSGTWSPSSTHQFRAGQLMQGNSWTDGRIDEVAVWSSVLTPAEIDRLWDCGSAGTDCLSCGQWRIGGVYVAS